MFGSVEKIRDKHILVAFTFAVALTIGWQRIFWDPSEGVGSGAGTFGAAEAAGIAALLLTGWRLGRDCIISKFGLCLICCCSLASVVPTLNFACVCWLVLGGWLIRGGDPRLQAYGQLLIAFVFYEILGRVVFDVIAVQILSVEAYFVSSLLGIFGDFHSNNLSIRAAGGHTILLETHCSAFHNISAATLLWIAMLRIERVGFERRDWIVLLVMILSTFILNTIRISLMAQSLPMYQYWHDGGGVQIFSLSLLGSLLAIVLAPKFQSSPERSQGEGSKFGRFA